MEVEIRSQTVTVTRALRPALLDRVLRKWWVAFAAATLFGVSAQLMIKAGLNANVASAGLTGPVLGLLLQPLVIEGLLIYALGTICWMTAVAQKEISFLYPLTSVNYVAVVAISRIVFHESVSLRRLGGVAVIIAGMLLMNRRTRKNA